MEPLAPGTFDTRTFWHLKALAPGTLCTWISWLPLAPLVPHGTPWTLLAPFCPAWQPNGRQMYFFFYVLYFRKHMQNTDTHFLSSSYRTRFPFWSLIIQIFGLLSIHFFLHGSLTKMLVRIVAFWILNNFFVLFEILKIVTTEIMNSCVVQHPIILWLFSLGLVLFTLFVCTWNMI